MNNFNNTSHWKTPQFAAVCLKETEPKKIWGLGSCSLSHFRLSEHWPLFHREYMNNNFNGTFYRITSQFATGYPKISRTTTTERQKRLSGFFEKEEIFVVSCPSQTPPFGQLLDAPKKVSFFFHLLSSSRKPSTMALLFKLFTFPLDFINHLIQVLFQDEWRRLKLNYYWIFKNKAWWKVYPYLQEATSVLIHLNH